MYGRQRLAVVIPAYNEERLIARTVRTVPAFVDHVVLVDDCSTDRTRWCALTVGDHRLEVIGHRRNRGVGAAIATGYGRALACGADIAVVLAGDGQMDPAEMDRLIEPIAVGVADYVKGNRLGHPELDRRMPPSRRLGNRVLTALTRLACGDATLNDTQCGYTAISRAAMQRVPLDALWPRYGYPNDLLGLLRVRGLRVLERPVTPIYGDEESGIRPHTVIPMLSFVLARTWLRRQRPR